MQVANDVRARDGQRSVRQAEISFRLNFSIVSAIVKKLKLAMGHISEGKGVQRQGQAIVTLLTKTLYKNG